jgi:hypothetical protein
MRGIKDTIFESPMYLFVYRIEYQKTNHDECNDKKRDMRGKCRSINNKTNDACNDDDDD